MPFGEKLKKNLEYAWDWANTPLVGRDYSIEEQIEDPKRITSPERVFALMSTPLAIAGELGGLGLAGRAAKTAKITKGIGPSERMTVKAFKDIPGTTAGKGTAPLNMIRDPQYKAYLGNQVMGRR